MVMAMGEDALNAVTKRPLCVKGAGTEGDWGIVDFCLLLGFLCLQSLRLLLRKIHLPLHKGGKY